MDKTHQTLKWENPNTWKTFYNAVILPKTDEEAKEWQRLPADSRRKIWSIQWQTLGRIVVCAVLMWASYLFIYWWSYFRLSYFIIMVLCTAILWPIFRYVAQKLSFIENYGIAWDKIQHWLQGKIIMRVFLFSPFVVLIPLSLWLTNPSLVGHEFIVNTASFSRDGKKVLTGSDDDTAIIWDVDTGKMLKHFKGHKDDIRSASFSPDGKKVLTGSWDDTAIIWDVDTGKMLKHFKGHESGVSSASFSPDGKKVLTGSWDDTAIIWDADTGKMLKHFKGHKDDVRSASFSPDGKKVLTGSWDDTAIIWDADTGKMLKHFKGHKDYVTSASFSWDGKKVLTGSDDDTAIIWDEDTGKILKPSKSPMRWSMDILWDADTGKMLKQFKGHEDDVNSWDEDIGKILKPSKSPMRWSMDILWDADTRKILKQFKGHEDDVTSASFSPDGKKVFTGSWDDTAILWDEDTGKILKEFKGHESNVTTVSFSPDGKKVLTGSWDDTAILWDADTGKMLWKTPFPFWDTRTWNLYDLLVLFVLVCLFVFFPTTRIFDKGRILYLRKPNRYLPLYDLPGIERWLPEEHLREIAKNKPGPPLKKGGIFGRFLVF
ncbi:membrane hypothetical protein [Candidatus Magnetomoraceae bacterium gMMP-15]